MDSMAVWYGYIVYHIGKVFPYTNCIYVLGHLSQKKFIYAVDRIGLLMHNPSPWSSRVFLSI